MDKDIHDDEKSGGGDYSTIEYSDISDDSDDSDTSTRHETDSDYIDTDSDSEYANDEKRHKSPGLYKDRGKQGQDGINRMVDARERIVELGNTDGPILSSICPPASSRIDISYDTRYAILMAAVGRLPNQRAKQILGDSTLMRVLLHRERK